MLTEEIITNEKSIRPGISDNNFFKISMRAYKVLEIERNYEDYEK